MTNSGGSKSDMDERWFRVMFEASSVPIALADEQGLLVAANAAYCEMVGRSWRDIEGTSSRDFTHPDDLGQHAAMETLMARAAACGETLRLEKRYVHPDGTVRWGWVSASTVVLDGRSWTSAVIHDTTERRTAEQALRIAATTDPLTGLLNRRGWREHLADLQRHAPSSLVIAMIDMDRFKAYNDAHGHGAGDHLLSTFARNAFDVLGPEDLFARWGGEEFALAMPGVDARSAHDALVRLASAVPGSQTFSAGYTALRSGESLYDCFDRADMWLYQAKRDGGAQYLTEPETRRTPTTNPLPRVPKSMINETDTPANNGAEPDRQSSITVADSALLRGQPVLGADGVLIGTAGAVLMNPKTMSPQWITVSVGDAGADRTVVPLTGAHREGQTLRLRHTADQIDAAPSIGASDALAPDDEHSLLAYYAGLQPTSEN